MEGLTYHIPVLLKETVDGLNIKPDGVYVDMTFGGGGHSREILSRLSAKGRLLSFDQDQDVQYGAVQDKRFTFVHSNYRFLKNWLRYYDIDKVDGILADLGVSSHHFDAGERGFSFRYDAPLDMRMNQRSHLTAQKVIQNYTEEQLADVFYLYGELKNSRQIAATLVKARTGKTIGTTCQLAEALRPLMGYDREKKDLARVFQALRIEVNGEMKALRQMLTAAVEVLARGGRLSVLTYHSLEDRITKNLIRTGNTEGKIQRDDIYGGVKAPMKAVNKNVITPTDEEINQNPRSRSAKLRVAVKL